jgi:hypothetical protein
MLQNVYMSDVSKCATCFCRSSKSYTVLACCNVVCTMHCIEINLYKKFYMHQNARRNYDNYKTASCDVLEAMLTNDSKVSFFLTECHTDWLSTLWRQKVSAEHHTLELLYLNYKIHECFKPTIFRNFLQKRIQTLNIFRDK